MRAIPEWMRPSTGPDGWDRPVEHLPKARRADLARRAAGTFAGLLAELLSAEEASAQRGFLQRMDPRAKIIGVAVLVVMATVLHALPALAALYGAAVAVALVSRVPLRRLARVWLVVPLFSVAIMLPAVLNVVTPGRSVLTLAHGLSITSDGLMVAARFVLRAAACVTLVLLLTSTTRPDRLFRGLRCLGVPRLFVMLLSMMERYLWVLARSAEEIHLAKIGRSIGQGSLRDERVWVAAGMGSLFRRTRSLGHEVYLAMISRGYTGEVHLLQDE